MRSRRTLTVKIPAGVDTGTRVQLAGEGEVGPGGGPAGDLYVEIHVAPHEVVHPARQRPALHGHAADDRGRARHDADPADPRGRRRRPSDESRRPELETSFELDVRPGTQSGADQVLRGRGVPGLRGGRGDLVVTIVVETPTRLDPRQEELLRELAAIRDEEQPSGQVRPGQKSVFGRLRDAFNHALMSLPVHLVPTSTASRVGAEVTVEGDEAHHAVAVRRLRVGEQVVLTDGAGTSVRGVVASTGKRVFTVDGRGGDPARAGPSPRSSSSRRSPRATAASSPSRC